MHHLLDQSIVTIFLFLQVKEDILAFVIKIVTFLEVLSCVTHVDGRVIVPCCHVRLTEIEVTVAHSRVIDRILIHRSRQFIIIMAK